MQEEKNSMEKQMTDLQTLNLHLKSKLKRKHNKDTQEIHPNSIDRLRINRKLANRTDQERERKENKKRNEQTAKKEINKNNVLYM